MFMKERIKEGGTIRKRDVKGEGNEWGRGKGEDKKACSIMTGEKKQLSRLLKLSSREEEGREGGGVGGGRGGGGGGGGCEEDEGGEEEEVMRRR